MITLHWKALLAAFFIFMTGIAVGVLGTIGYGVRHTRALLREPAAAPGRFERAAGRIEKRLVDELALDETQAAAVHREFARTATELRSLRVETVQRTRRTIAATLLRIGAELPPEKRAELRRLASRRLQRLGMESTIEPVENGAAAPAPQKD
ncbi:MAG: hypothetical protein QM691_12065 [Opitutaceae bacterium]